MSDVEDHEKQRRSAERCNHRAYIPTARELDDGSGEGTTVQGYTCDCGWALKTKPD